jgi:magnesium transporter
MATTPPFRRVPIVLATSALSSFTSASRAAALALPELGFAAFFIGGVLRATSGPIGPWLVVLAALLGLGVRRLDLEHWTLFISGGLTGRAERTFGPRVANAATGVVAIERVLLTALACAVFGQYVAASFFTVTGYVRFPHQATSADFASVVALTMMAWLWIRARRGSLLTPAGRARHVWIAVGLLVVLLVFAIVAVAARGAWGALVPSLSDVSLGPRSGLQGYIASPVWLIIALLAGFGRSASAIGVADSISRAAHELEPPRIAGLRRTIAITGAAALLLTGGLSLATLALVPAADPRWANAPLSALSHAAGPSWLQGLLTIAVIASAALLLGQTARAGLWGAEGAVVRLSQRGAIGADFQTVSPKTGNYTSAVDAGTMAAAFAVVVTGAGVTWLAAAYAAAVLWTLLFQTVTLLRFRKAAGRSAPGVVAIALLLGVAAVAMLVHADAGAVGATGALASVAVLLGFRKVERTSEPAGTEDIGASELLPSDRLSIEQLSPRPGSILVPVRNPNLLTHLVAALRSPGDRDIVVVSVRLVGVDAADTGTDETQPTPAERQLFSRVLAVAERHGRVVRLLIVPAKDVFDAIVSTVIRLQANEVYVGESTTLPAEAQARLLGEAWERADAPPIHVGLTIFRHSGRVDTFHLGAHAPEMRPADLDLIHHLWLDAVKTVGPHVHHHDIVRAALTTMAEQINGPDRDQALQAIRNVAKPAEELVAVLRSRDYSRLRDMVRNRPASDLAELLSDLSPEDQAIAFRLLPRQDAAETFEYLDQDGREALLKTLSKEDVAALLNDMAPDDRTTFLEELPANVTRELLSLLTPKERAIAVTLLGYPERTVGRLMTPDYIAVKEDWTVQQVLDYVRTHGRDSETLNVIYVVDHAGALIDDIRIREFLLTDPKHSVSELMDRRFVALKAADDQAAAVVAFKQHDRSALPVTDSAGVLIGIVTIDDVLDVAEAEATKDIQRIGGSEALDEPYMQIAMHRMVRKRAGWLTALFLGEMLTATALGFFENEIGKAIVLTLFLPLIISSGGNSGSQGSTLVIRALALGEVKLRDWWRIMRREIVAGFALGTILACVGFLRITVWSAFSDIYGAHWLLVAITVAVALIGVVMWGTLIGALMPLLLRRLGFDPATSSAPFVATLVDVTGLIIYFSVASVILRGTLL